MTKQVNWPWLICPQVGVPALGLAHPGCGKTAIARAIAESLQRRFLPIMLSQKLPEDLGGLPQAIEDKTLGWVVQKIMEREMAIARAEPTVVLLDELTNVPHSVQAVALETWLNNLPKDCWAYAAANPVESAASAQGLTPPAVNRIWMGEFETDDAQWLGDLGRDGFDDNGKPMDDIPWSIGRFPRVSADWRQFRPFWSGAVKGFLEQNPELIAKFPDEIERQSLPHTSKRSWHNTIKCLSACDDVGADGDVRQKIAQGLVGEKEGMALMQFVDDMQLPDATAVLNDANWQVPQAAGLAIAIFRSVKALVEQRVGSAEAPALAGIWWEKFRSFAYRVFRQRQEYGMMLNAWAFTPTMKPKGYTPKPPSDAEAAKGLAEVAKAVRSS